ncbi:MAG: arginine decarboxylase, partial [Bacteroidales bacterium]|nr:arginine decarboxylase [Bacteroidales bacterium]
MKNKYIDLIEQTFDFPQEDFKVEKNELIFHDIPLMDIIKEYGTPLKITYLPKITEQIEKARRWFRTSMAKVDYQGKYFYSFCTKSSHFSFVLEQILKVNAHIETSSAFDINIIEELAQKKLLDKKNYILCNGFKREQYLKNIRRLIENDFVNTIPILDNLYEIDYYTETIKDKPINLGIRIATEEEPKFMFYTSRLGIRYDDVLSFYTEKIKPQKNLKLKMLHFFINTGINDTAYYWNELSKGVQLYCKLKKINPDLQFLNIGGGLPIKSSLSFEYNYEYMIDEIINRIKIICSNNDVPEPDIFTEFGNFTIGESMANIFTIINQKRQNDRELWNMINNSFLTSLPDTWAIKQKYILLPVNQWEQEYERVFLGGLTCDSEDYYNSENHSNAIFLPKYKANQKLHIGFFHTGAYQEALSGYGGIKHC